MLLSLQRGQHQTGCVGDLTLSLHDDQLARFFVERFERFGLLMVGLEAFEHSLRLIILADHRIPAALVADALGLRGHGRHMVARLPESRWIIA